MYIIISLLFSFLFSIVPIVVIVALILRAVQASRRRNQKIQRHNTQVTRAPQYAPEARHNKQGQRTKTQQPKTRKALFTELKQEIQSLADDVREQQNIPKRNQHVVQKKHLSTEQKQQQEATKQRILAEREDREGTATLQVSPSLAKPKVAPVKKAKTKSFTLEKKNLAQAIIYKEILDKPVALRDR